MCTDILFKVSVFVCLISALVLVFFFLGVELIYSVVVVSGVQHSDSVVCVCVCVCSSFFREGLSKWNKKINRI